jgi:hypothetical protein
VGSASGVAPTALPPVGPSAVPTCSIHPVSVPAASISGACRHHVPEILADAEGADEQAAGGRRVGDDAMWTPGATEARADDPAATARSGGPRSTNQRDLDTSEYLLRRVGGRRAEDSSVGDGAHRALIRRPTANRPTRIGRRAPRGATLPSIVRPRSHREVAKPVQLRHSPATVTVAQRRKSGRRLTVHADLREKGRHRR